MVGTLLLGLKSCIWDISFKMYDVSKSIPVAKSQNFVGKKPTWVKFLEFDLFYLKRQGYIDITKASINLGSHHLHTQILR